MRRVCVFCGSSDGVLPGYRDLARRLGAALVDHGLGLVYGGGDVGLMGVIADSVIERGGEAVGVIPEQLVAMEVAHQHLSALHVVDTMHARKAMMAELSDAFIALPGGMGTLEELFEVLTWAQLGFHDKPTALLDDAGYWQPLLAMLDHAVREGFVKAEHRALLAVADDAGSLLRSWGAVAS